MARVGDGVDSAGSARQLSLRTAAGAKPESRPDVKVVTWTIPPDLVCDTVRLPLTLEPCAKLPGVSDTPYEVVGSTEIAAVTGDLVDTIKQLTVTTHWYPRGRH